MENLKNKIERTALKIIIRLIWKYFPDCVDYEYNPVSKFEDSEKFVFSWSNEINKLYAKNGKRD